MKQAGIFFLALLVALPAQAGGDSSDGHSHAAPSPVPTIANAPRATAATEEFEVVAVVEGKQLVIYVDHFASNAPVSKAKIEIDGAGLKGVASESAPGTYRMELAAAIPAARHPLTIAIETDDSADLLTVTLDTSLPVSGEAHVHGWSEWAVWIVAALMLLTGAALLAARRKRQRK